MDNSVVRMGSEEAGIEELEQKQQTGSVVGVSRRKLADSCFKAVAASRFHQVKFLLDNGVAPNIKNDLGQNLLVAALHIPDADKRRRMLTYLLSRAVPCSGRDEQGRDVLSWACILGYTKQLEQIAAAAMGNVDLHRQDGEGMTPLHHAVRHAHIHIVRILITMMSKFRLSVDVPDVHGLTPYLYARRLGHSDIAEVLVQDGNASRKQFDTQAFHSADEWAVIGAAERKERQRDARERKLALYKIRGRLPPMQHKVPQLCLNDNNHSNKEDILTGRSMDTALDLLRFHPDARVIPSNNLRERGPGRVEVRRGKEAIPSIMEILADQTAPSYRSPAITKLPPVTDPRFRRCSVGGSKGRISTLAILMHGKNGQGTTGRRKSIAPH